MHSQNDFGRTRDGQFTTRYVYREDDGTGFTCTDYGAALLELIVRDKNDNLVDVILGFDSIEALQAHTGYAGAICGRFANRIKNGRFRLNGRTYQLEQNDGPNHLHGGSIGFDKRIWEVVPIEHGYRLTLISPDGDGHYPGNLTVQIDYRWQNETLSILYHAQSDHDTIVNLTNHAYFNLNGSSGSGRAQHLLINADAFVETDSQDIPTGAILPVAGPFDFRTPRNLRDILDDPHPYIKQARGLNHNFIINDVGSEPAAQLYGDQTGIVMSVITDSPGIQIYTGNYIDDWQGKDGQVYTQHDGIAMETQYYPDSPNQRHFPSPRLNASEIWSHATHFKFTRRR